MASQLPELEVDEAFRTVLRCSTAAVVALDLDGRVVAWSRGARRIFGWEEDEVLGEPLPVISPRQEEAFRKQLARLRRGEAVEGLVRSHRRKDGSRVEVTLSVHPLRGAGGDVSGVVALATEHPPPRPEGEEVERRLHELQAQLEELEARNERDGLPARFLLNSLHAVSVLLRKGEHERAVRTLSRLGSLLRHVVFASTRERVAVRDEVAFLESYVALESLRMGDGVRLEVRVDAGVRDRPVPSLLLLPLVELAVRRRGPDGEARRIRLEAAGSEGGMLLEVADRGRAAPSVQEEDEADAEEAVGGVRRRLARIEGARLERERDEEGGAIWRVWLPLPEGDAVPVPERTRSTAEEET